MSTRFLLFALIAFNLVAKLLWLDVNELANDEPFTVYWSQQPLATFWDMLRTENNPPLYFLLIKAWSAIVPFEAGWLRVPSALFSALAVWPLFLLAHRLAGLRVALVASLLFSLNNYHYGFAHEVRAYSLFSLLATTGIWLLWRAQDEPRNGIRAMLGLSALNAVMVYTHFFGWLAIGVQALCVLLLPELKPLRRNFLFGAVITLAWFSPYVLIFVQRAGTSIAHGTWLGAAPPEELYNMVWRWSNAPVLAVAFLALILFAAVRSRMAGSAIRLAIMWCMLPLLGMFAISFVVPMFLDRYLVYAAPGFALLVAISIGSTKLPSKAQAILSALAIGGMACTFTPWGSNGRYPSAVIKQASAWQRGGEPVLLQPWWYAHTYVWHTDRDLMRSPQGLQWDLGKGFVYPVDGGADMPIDPSEYEGVVLVDAGSDLVDPAGTVKQVLARAFAHVDSVEADHRVWVFRFHR